MNEIEQLRAELNEIGGFQNDVRDLVIKMTGAPSDAIDGKGSDAGWQEFTLAEISQGIAFVKDELERVKRQNASMASCLSHIKQLALGCREDPKIILSAVGLSACGGLDPDAGRDYIAKESVRPLVEALRTLHEKMSEPCNVFFEQDGKPIDIETDLGEAYQDSELCEKTVDALRDAHHLGLLEDAK